MPQLQPLLRSVPGGLRGGFLSRDLAQCENENADVLVEKLDGIAGILLEALLGRRRFRVLSECLGLGVVNGQRHQLNVSVCVVYCHRDPPFHHKLASKRLTPIRELNESAKRIEARWNDGPVSGSVADPEELLCDP